MARDEFEIEVMYPRDVTDCWEAFSDVERMVKWISILHDLIIDEPLVAYRATLRDRIGPFALSAGLTITVEEIDPPTGATILGEGEDRGVGSRLRFSATLALEPDPSGSGTRATIRGWYEVTGKIAGLGDAMIHRRARAILNDFTEGSRNELT